MWLKVLTLPGTPYAEAFLREIERFVLRTFGSWYAMARVEWSKGYAYTDDAAWSDGEEGWGQAAGILEQLDPHRVFGNAFLDRLFA